MGECSIQVHSTKTAPLLLLPHNCPLNANKTNGLPVPPNPGLIRVRLQCLATVIAGTCHPRHTMLNALLARSSYLLNWRAFHFIFFSVPPGRLGHQALWIFTGRPNTFLLFPFCCCWQGGAWAAGLVRKLHKGAKQSPRRLLHTTAPTLIGRGAGNLQGKQELTLCELETLSA